MFTNEYVVGMISHQVRDEREKEAQHARLIRSLNILRRANRK